MRAEHAMPKIRIGKRGRREPSRIVVSSLVHGLNYVHAHFGDVDGWGKAARPNVMAGNFPSGLSSRGGGQVVLNVNRAGESRFVQRKVVQLQVAPFPTFRKSLREI